MVINKFISDVIEEYNVELELISSSTGYSIQKLESIINCRCSVSLPEATEILKVLDIDVWDILTLGN